MLVIMILNAKLNISASKFATVLQLVYFIYQNPAILSNITNKTLRVTRLDSWQP